MCGIQARGTDVGVYMWGFIVMAKLDIIHNVIILRSSILYVHLCVSTLT